MRSSRICRNLSQVSVGFIGLGRMGYAMSLNLRNKLPTTSTLFVHDTDDSVVSLFCREPTTTNTTNTATTSATSTSLGAKVKKSSIGEIAESCHVVLTMLPNTSHVSSVYLDQSSPFSAGKASSSTSRVLLDCSTIDPDVSKDIASTYAETKAGVFMDAPVSGGVTGAKNATLSFMIGSCGVHEAQSDVEKKSIERATEILGMMGRTMHFCGSRGDGLRAKLINNYLLALTNLATCEAMRLGVKLNVAPEILGSVINSSTGTCWPSLKNNPVLGITPGAPVERDYDGGFGIELMMKDLGLAIDLATRQNVKLPSADAAMRTYTDASKVFGGKDFGVVMKYLESIE